MVEGEKEETGSAEVTETFTLPPLSSIRSEPTELRVDDETYYAPLPTPTSPTPPFPSAFFTLCAAVLLVLTLNSLALFLSAISTPLYLILVSAFTTIPMSAYILSRD